MEGTPEVGWGHHLPRAGVPFTELVAQPLLANAGPTPLLWEVTCSTGSAHKVVFLRVNGHVGYAGHVPGSLVPTLTTEAGSGTGREHAGVPGGFKPLNREQKCRTRGSACTWVNAEGEFIGTVPLGAAT